MTDKTENAASNPSAPVPPKLAVSHSAHIQKTWPPLEQVTRPTVPTKQAAYYLDRKEQTLRKWASQEPEGGIKPLRINGRLAWPVNLLCQVLGVK